MKEIIKQFNNEKVRVILKNGQPFFNAQDICKSLHLTNTSEALRVLEKDDIISNDTTDKLGRVVNVLFVSEEGLYDLIMKSRKKEAKSFRRWITHEVLPSIRKTGKYSIPGKLKELSTEKRNLMTDQWKNHGVDKPYQYIQLTLQEYKALNIENKKAQMTEKELLLLTALETMESLKLIDNEQIAGYYDCKDSLIETATQIKAIETSNKKAVKDDR